MEINDNDNNQNEPKLTLKGLHDYHLIRAALDNNDQKAYTELLSRYNESVYYIMFKIVGNATDAEDLTIEAIGKTFNQLHKYSPAYSFSTWLFRIATNHAIDFIRNNKLKRESSVDLHRNEDDSWFDSFEHFHSSNHTPDEELEQKQKEEQMRDIVEQLNPRYKLLISAFYFEELSYEEISSKFNIPIGTIKGQLSRAREFLAFILRKRKGKL